MQGGEACKAENIYILPACMPAPVRFDYVPTYDMYDEDTYIVKLFSVIVKARQLQLMEATRVQRVCVCVCQ